MYPTPSRRERASTTNDSHPGRPTPGYQAVFLALFVAALWTASNPDVAAALATGAAAVALGRRYARTWFPPATDRPR